MAANSPDVAIKLNAKSQERIVNYAKACIGAQNQQWDMREQLKQADLLYQRETDLTTDNTIAKQANKAGNANLFQNIVVPVVLPQVEAAVAYQASVFLTGEPLFGVVASVEYEDQAVALETVIAENSVRGGWTRHLQMLLRDGFKYNIGALEVSWDKQVSPSFESKLDFSKDAKVTETLWEGNCIKHLDMYNVFFDSRVKPTEIYKDGEYAGYTELMGRVQLKKFIASLTDVIIENVVPAFESPSVTSGGGSSDTSSSFFIPSINPNAILDTTIVGSRNFDWNAWSSDSNSTKGASIGYKNIYEVTTLYGRILPSDFGLSVQAPNTAQVWKFIIVNNSVIISATRQTNAHNYIPILFCQPLEDGLGYQTKSLANNVAPIQSIASASWNSIIAARRRAISDRGLYDPSRVSEHHINSPNPSAKIPVRPAAYGKPLGEAYYPIPFRDDQSGTLLQETATILSMANLTTGQNPARGGQFVKGNKTRDEFNSVMANSNGRDQLVSILLEAQLFTPLKEILKVNILQYQGGISLYSREKARQISVDPLELRKAVLNFKISDGLVPSSKIISSDVLQTAFQVLSQSQQLGQEYELGKLFSYLMKTQGASITDFEKSPETKAYEQASQQWFMLAQQALAKGTPFNAPQPKPADYGVILNKNQPTGAQ